MPRSMRPRPPPASPSPSLADLPASALLQIADASDFANARSLALTTKGTLDSLDKHMANRMLAIDESGASDFERSRPGLSVRIPDSEGRRVDAYAGGVGYGRGTVPQGTPMYDAARLRAVERARIRAAREMVKALDKIQSVSRASAILKRPVRRPKYGMHLRHTTDFKLDPERAGYHPRTVTMSFELVTWNGTPHVKIETRGIHDHPPRLYVAQHDWTRAKYDGQLAQELRDAYARSSKIHEYLAKYFGGPV